MHPIGQHITLRLTTDRPLLLDVTARRAAARLTLRHGAESALMFFIYADTHAHLLVMQEEPAVATEVARRLELALYRKLALGPFEPARVRPIENMWHLDRALHYCLRQHAHHGIETDPLLEASNVPDLLGLRELGAYTRPTLRAWLPRFSRDDLVASLPCAPRDDTMVSFDQLAEAAAAAVALPSLHTRQSDAVEAKRAAVAVGAALTNAKLSELLGLQPRTVRKLRLREADPNLVRAIRRQLSVRAPKRPQHPPDAASPPT